MKTFPYTRNKPTIIIENLPGSNIGNYVKLISIYFGVNTLIKKGNKRRIGKIRVKRKKKGKKK